MKKLLLLFFMALSVQLFAQDAKITGTVTTNENSAALSNASITVKDKVLGTTTNSKGNFTLNFKGKLPVTLIISAVGYETKEVELTSASQNVTVSLDAKSITLNEVVS